MANNAYLLRCTRDRRGAADRRRRPSRQALLRADRRRRRCAPSSRRTGTGTTTGRCPRSSRRPAPSPSPHPADAADLPGAGRSAPVEHGDTVDASATQTLEVIHLRGHTPGQHRAGLRGPATSASHVFTGDSPFPGGVGNTQKDAARFAEPDRRRRAADFLVTPPDETWGYPGHGKDTTLGAERPHLEEEWRARGW